MISVTKNRAGLSVRASLPEIWGRGRKQFDYAAHEVVDVEPLGRRCGEHFGRRQQFLPPVDDGLELLAAPFEQVDLVDYKQHRHFLFGHFGEVVGILGRIFDHVGSRKAARRRR